MRQHRVCQRRLNRTAQEFDDQPSRPLPAVVFANANAERPGGSLSPKSSPQMLGRGARFSTTSSGKAFKLASLMYVLSVCITAPTVSGLPTGDASATAASIAAREDGNVIRAAAKPPNPNNWRRVKVVPLSIISISFSIRVPSVVSSVSILPVSEVFAQPLHTLAAHL
jgi:hypothetical protein